MSDIITAVKLGTSTISAAAGRLNSDHTLDILAYTHVKAKGLNRSYISDLKLFVKSLKELFSKLEKKLGFKLNYSYLGFSGPHISSFLSTGKVNLGSRKEVCTTDIDKVIESAKLFSMPTGKTLLHIIPGLFILDDQENIQNPYGMIGSNLEVRANIILSDMNVLHNFYNAFSSIGIEVEPKRGFIFNGLASSLSVLSKEEKESGVILIDIGAFSTDYLVYYKGELLLAGSLPYGSANLTNDIRIYLKTSWQEAERLKCEYIDFNNKNISEDEYIEFLPYYSNEYERFSKLEFYNNLVKPRIDDILDRVDVEIQRHFPKEYSPLVGVVITGGGALLKGIEKEVRSVFSLPARVGKCVNLVSVPEELNTPQYTDLLGILKYGMDLKLEEKLRQETMKIENPGLLARLHKFVASLLFF